MTPTTLPRTHAARVAHWLRPAPVTRDRRNFGAEIGAFKTPIPGLRPLYFDRFPAFGYEKVVADYFADACALPLSDHALDYVATSHVLEHVANPVRALWEWARVTRPGGILYLIVPDRRFTFDHTRGLTAPAHLIDDFARGTTDSDGTHISDYLDGVDWTRWNPAGSPAENAATREQLRAAYLAAVAAREDINIHFHTFELASFTALIGLMNLHPARPATLEFVDAAEHFPEDCPNGFLAVLRVRKNLPAPLVAWLRRLRARGDVRATLLPHAKPF